MAGCHRPLGLFDLFPASGPVFRKWMFPPHAGGLRPFVAPTAPFVIPTAPFVIPTEVESPP